jgi:hypothetical protein
MTWPEAGFDHYAIRGPLADLGRLASLIEGKLADSGPGSTVRIRDTVALHVLPGLTHEDELTRVDEVLPRTVAFTVGAV